jgi:hypothetical protein
MYSLRWAPTGRLQFDASWQKSDIARSGATNGGLVTGREILTSRLLWALSRRWRVNLGFSRSDPGQVTEARQVDATVTWRMFE